MSAGTQCDNCRRFGPSHAPSWFFLAQQPGDEEVVSVMAALFGRPREPFTFCTVRCLAEWAYVHAAAVGAPDGTEPPPRSGIGWPS